MTRNACYILLIACIFLSLSGNICLAQRASGRQATAEVQQLNLPELKNISMMIARGEPQEKYLAVWKQLVSKSRNMDIHEAIDLIMDEAKKIAGLDDQGLRSSDGRSPVTARSRHTISTTIHAGTRPTWTSEISCAAISSLSATGSSSLPSAVT